MSAQRPSASPWAARRRELYEQHESVLPIGWRTVVATSECPTCGAWPGQHCVDERIARYVPPHAARYRLPAQRPRTRQGDVE